MEMKKDNRRQRIGKKSNFKIENYLRKNIFKNRNSQDEMILRARCIMHNIYVKLLISDTYDDLL